MSQEELEYKKEHEEFRRDISMLTHAIFGNPDIADDGGIRKQVAEIHGMIVNAKGFGKISKWALTTVIMVGAAVTAVFEIVKRLK